MPLLMTSQIILGVGIFTWSSAQYRAWSCGPKCPNGRILPSGPVPCCPTASRYSGYSPESDLKFCDLYPKGYETLFSYCRDRMDTPCCRYWLRSHCRWTTHPSSGFWTPMTCPNATGSQGEPWCLWDTRNAAFITDY